MPQHSTAERARYAWESLGHVGEHAREYRSLVRGLPALVEREGLLRVCSALQARGGEAHTLLLRQIQGWLQQRELLADTAALIDILIAADRVRTRHLTEEVLALVGELKRMVDAR